MSSATAGLGERGFGCMGITALYGPPMSDEDALELLRGVHDSGCRHFDTAEMYRSGDPYAPDENTKYNEDVLGKFFATLPRGSFTVGTKYDPGLHEDMCDYDTVRPSLLKSLERLQVASLDVYYLHRVPSERAALDFMAAGKRFVEEGLVQRLGLSEVGAAWLRAAHAVHPVSFVQQEWSLLTRSLEEDLVPACRDLGVGIVAYSPLARNLLTVPQAPPEAADRRASVPRFERENWEANVRLAAQVRALAERKGATAAQLSLAWLRAKAAELGVAVLPIPGSTRLAHALENFRGLDLEVGAEEMAALEGLAGRVAGARSDAACMAQLIERQPKRQRKSGGFAALGPGLLSAGPQRLWGRERLPWASGAPYPELLGEPAELPWVFEAHGDQLAGVRSLAARLAELGAVVIRGLELTTAEGVSELVQSVPELGEPREFVGGGTSKSRRGAFVRTSSDEPHWQDMEPHADMSHSHEFPRNIAFFMAKAVPAGVGGETVLVDQRKVTRELREAGIVDLFESRGGVLYRKMFRSEEEWGGPMRGYSWQQRFFTADKAECSERLGAMQSGSTLRWEWSGSTLLVQNTEPATRRHPSGEELWFNGVHTNHRSYYDSAPHIDTELGSPMSTAFGDGGEIPADVLTAIRAAVWRNAVAVRLQQGDLLLVDNMLVLHGRLHWREGYERELWQTHFA